MTRGAGLTGVDLQLRGCDNVEDAPHNVLSRQLLLKSPQRQCSSGLFPFTSPLVFFSTACEGLGASHVALVVKNPPASTGDIRDASSIPGRKVQSLGWEDPLEKEMQPTPVFLPGESHGQRRLVGFRSEGHKGSDMTEAT